MPYRVYLLRNGIGSSYIGLSEEVARRVDEHNKGKSRWTKSGGPWRLVWQSRWLSLGEARKLEATTKRQHGNGGLVKIDGTVEIAKFKKAVVAGPRWLKKCVEAIFLRKKRNFCCIFPKGRAYIVPFFNRGVEQPGSSSGS